MKPELAIGIAVLPPALLAAHDAFFHLRDKQTIQRQQEKLQKMGDSGHIVEVAPSKNPEELLVTVEGAGGVTDRRPIDKKLFEKRGLELGQEVEIRARGAGSATLFPKKDREIEGVLQP